MIRRRRGQALVTTVWESYDREAKALRQSQAAERKAPLAPAVADDIRKRAELEAALEARRRRRPEAQPTQQPEQNKTPEAQPPPPSSAVPERRGPVRLELPEIDSDTPEPEADDAARRREALKAEFRRQAEEIARRRKERERKDRDRDRER